MKEDYLFDLELRFIYKRTLDGLLTLEFENDYFSVPESKKIIVSAINQLKSIETCVPAVASKTESADFSAERSTNSSANSRVDENLSKEELRTTLASIDFNKLSEKNKDRIFFEKINYPFANKIFIAFSANPGVFRLLNFSNDDIGLLVAITLLHGTILKDLFHTELWAREETLKLLKYVLKTTEDELEAGISKTIEGGFCLDDSVFNIITENIQWELDRLGTLPCKTERSCTDYRFVPKVKDSELFHLNNSYNPNVISFTGETITEAVFSLLCEKNILFWYCDNQYDCIEILDYIHKKKHNEKFYSAHYIWFDDVKNEDAEVLPFDFFKGLTDIDNSFLIVSGKDLSMPFDTKPHKISMKASCWPERAANIISNPELLKHVNPILKKIPSNKKEDFLDTIYANLNNLTPHRIEDQLIMGYELFLRSKTDLDKSKMSEEDKTTDEEETAFRPLDLRDFKNHYGDIRDLDDEKIEVKKLMNLVEKLIMPGEYLQVNTKMLEDLRHILGQYPNIVESDKGCLFAVLKNSILFSENNRVNIPNLLLVGTPGCGKTRLGLQLTKIFGQTKPCLIPIGTGNGWSEIAGLSKSYKNSAPGKLLNAIFETAPKGKTNMSPIVVFDELDKSFENSHDENQQLTGLLCQLLARENMKNGFTDNFLEVPVNVDWNFIFTANETDTIPDAILDRLTIINFREYTAEEMDEIIIPSEYEHFKSGKKLSKLPLNLSALERNVILALSAGSTRQVENALNIILSLRYDDKGKEKPNAEYETAIKHLLDLKSNKGKAKIGFTLEQ